MSKQTQRILAVALTIILIAVVGVIIAGADLRNTIADALPKAAPTATAKPTLTPTNTPLARSYAATGFTKQANGWDRLGTPTGWKVRNIAVARDTGNTLYACMTNDGFAPTFFRSMDSGKTWTPLTIGGMAPKAFKCAITPATDDPQQVVASAMPFDHPGKDQCQYETFAVSHDGGTVWEPIKLAGNVDQNILNSDDCSLIATKQYTFLTYENNTTKQGLLRTSNGINWETLLTDVREVSGDRFAWINVISSQIIQSASDIPGQSGYSLWISSDGGEHSKLVNAGGTLPLGSSVCVEQFTDVATPSEKMPYYLVRNNGPWQTGDGYTTTVEVTYDNVTYSALPPLPINGTTPDRSGVRYCDIVGAKGGLLVNGVDPTDTIQPPNSVTHMKPFVYWVWNRAAQTWIAQPFTTLPAVAYGPSMQTATADGTEYWVTTQEGFGNDMSETLYRVDISGL